LKKSAVFLALLMLNILLLGCGEVYPTTTPTPAVRPSPVVGNGSGDIKIGFIGPLTGPNAAYATAMRRGVLMALEEQKALGGINGRKFALIERNDQTSPDVVKTVFVDLVEKERVVAVIGVYGEEAGLALAPLANQWRVPWLIPAISSYRLNTSSGEYIFRLCVTEVEQAEFMVASAHKRGFQRIALVSDSARINVEGRKLLQNSLKNIGLAPVFDETFFPEDKPEEHKIFIKELQGVSPDVLLYWGSPGAAGQLRTLMAESGLNWPVIGQDNLGLMGFGRQLPQATDNIFSMQTFLPDTQNPRHDDFLNHYKRQFNTDQLDYPGLVAQSYDATRLLIVALKKPGAADNRETLKAALEDASYLEGLIKIYLQPWKAGSSREALSHQDLLLAQWKNGKLVRADQP
jgi:branched-chain amino acid transport system substrate-binding protein